MNKKNPAPPKAEVSPINGNPELLSTKQVSLLLGISAPTLCLWRQQKKHIPYMKIAGVIRYKLEDLEKFAQGETYEVQER